MALSWCFVVYWSLILQNSFSWKKKYPSWERHEGEYMMTVVFFFRWILPENIYQLNIIAWYALKYKGNRRSVKPAKMGKCSHWLTSPMVCVCVCSCLQVFTMCSRAACLSLLTVGVQMDCWGNLDPLICPDFSFQAKQQILKKG